MFEETYPANILKQSELYFDGPNLAYHFLDAIEKFDQRKGSDYEIFVGLVRRFFKILLLTRPKSVSIYSDGFAPLSKTPIRDKRALMKEKKRKRLGSRLSSCSRLMHEMIMRIVADYRAVHGQLPFKFKYELSGSEAEDAIVVALTTKDHQSPYQVIVSADSDFYRYQIRNGQQIYLMSPLAWAGSKNVNWSGRIRMIDQLLAHKKLMTMPRFEKHAIRDLESLKHTKSLVPQTVRNYYAHEFVNVYHLCGKAMGMFSSYKTMPSEGQDLNAIHRSLGQDLKVEFYRYLLVWYFKQTTIKNHQPQTSTIPVEERGKVNDCMVSFKFSVDLNGELRSIESIHSQFPYLNSVDNIVEYLATTSTQCFPDKLSSTLRYLNDLCTKKEGIEVNEGLSKISDIAKFVYDRLNLLIFNLQAIGDVIPGVLPEQFPWDLRWKISTYSLQSYFNIAHQ